MSNPLHRALARADATLATYAELERMSRPVGTWDEPTRPPYYCPSVRTDPRGAYLVNTPGGYRYVSELAHARSLVELAGAGTVVDTRDATVWRYAPA